jgi:hypothetical protein
VCVAEGGLEKASNLVGVVVMEGSLWARRVSGRGWVFGVWREREKTWRSVGRAGSAGEERERRSEAREEQCGCKEEEEEKEKDKAKEEDR